jgi:hypothetical protein
MSEEIKEEKVYKSSGSIKEMSIKLNDPKMDLDFTDIRQLMLLVGKNGTGKTFMLITTWFLTYVLQARIISDMEGRVFDAEPFAQFVFDNTFHTPENMTGSLQGRFENGPTIHIDIDQGKITAVYINTAPEINTPMPVIYMSSNLRLFTAMDMYLSMRKMTGEIQPDKIIAKMLGAYKLYDIAYVEGLISRMPITASQKLKDRFTEFDITENIEQFDVDPSDCKFFAIVDGKRKDLCTYGNGHQALFNMFIAQPS